MWEAKRLRIREFGFLSLSRFLTIPELKQIVIIKKRAVD
jgi:hypothetical protein